MTTKRIEHDEKCKTCKGTGLYVGFAENDGAAVVCSNCKGTGCVHFVHEYEEFEGRTIKPDVDWVFQCNPGIGIGTGGEHQLRDFGGMSYDAWLEFELFPTLTEMRRFVCPAWWYQSVDYTKKPKWDKCQWGGTFSGCKYFDDKAACWELWDTEIGEKGEER